MIVWPCQYTGCDRKTVPLQDHCRACRKRLCAQHSVDPFHSCTNLVGDDLWRAVDKAHTAELDRMQHVISTLNIAQTAEELLPGQHARLPSYNIDDLGRGNTNIHIPIEFDDGQKWIARARQISVDSAPRVISRLAMQGEIDTLKLLHSVGLPVPRVKSSIIEDGQVDYYFMSHLHGRPYGTPLWAPSGDWPKGVPREIVSRTITQLAKYHVIRSNHPFRGIGSLIQDSPANTWSVGPLITQSLACMTPPHFKGPFRTSAEKWVSHCDEIILGIQDGSVYAKDREMAFLVYMWIKETVQENEPYNREEDTYVTHEDANGGHIMADREGNITGLIDWEWASVSPKIEAFSSPLALVECNDFFSGSNSLSWAERQLMDEYVKLGRPDLAECVEKGKAKQWLNWIVGSEGEWKEYCFIKALGEAMGLEMVKTMEEFLGVQRGKYGAQLESA